MMTVTATKRTACLGDVANVPSRRRGTRRLRRSFAARLWHCKHPHRHLAAVFGAHEGAQDLIAYLSDPATLDHTSKIFAEATTVGIFIYALLNWHFYRAARKQHERDDDEK